MSYWSGHFSGAELAVPFRLCTHEAYCCAVKPSPLLEGGKESCIQYVFLRLPSAVPVSQRQRGEAFGTTHGKDRMSERAHTPPRHILSRQFCCVNAANYRLRSRQWRMVNPAIAKSYSVDSVKQWTHPSGWKLLTPDPPPPPPPVLWRTRASRPTAKRTISTHEQMKWIFFLKEKKERHIHELSIATESGVQLCERPGWSAVLPCRGYYILTSETSPSISRDIPNDPAKKK